MLVGSLIYSAPGLVILVRSRFLLGPFSLKAPQPAASSVSLGLFTAELHLNSGQRRGNWLLALRIEPLVLKIEFFKNFSRLSCT